MNSGNPFDQEALLRWSIHTFHSTSSIAAWRKKKKKNQMLVKFKNCESCAPLAEINWLKFSFLPPCQFWPTLSSYRAVVNLGSGERPNRLLGAFSTDVDMRSGTLRQRQSWTAVPSRWLVLAVVKAPDCAVLGQFL